MALWEIRKSDTVGIEILQTICKSWIKVFLTSITAYSYLCTACWWFQENPKPCVWLLIDLLFLTFCKNQDSKNKIYSSLVNHNLRRCPWCNGYRCRKWTRRHEFKSRTRLIAFHIVLIPSGKVWIQFFSLQLWVNSTTD